MIVPRYNAGTIIAHIPSTNTPSNSCVRQAIHGWPGSAVGPEHVPFVLARYRAASLRPSDGTAENADGGKNAIYLSAWWLERLNHNYGYERLSILWLERFY